MIAIGKINKSIGIKGEVKASVFSDNPGRFAALQRVWLGSDDNSGSEHRIESYRTSGKQVVLKLSGIDTRTQADEVRERYILVRDEEAVRPRNSYFVHELIGMEVVSEQGRTVGTIGDVVGLPAGDAWVVRIGEREVYVPGVKEFIHSVDLKTRRVVIRVPEGLID